MSDTFAAVFTVFSIGALEGELIFLSKRGLLRAHFQEKNQLINKTLFKCPISFTKINDNLCMIKSFSSIFLKFYRPKRDNSKTHPLISNIYPSTYTIKLQIFLILQSFLPISYPNQASSPLVRQLIVLLLSIDNRYIIMDKMLFLVALLALTLAAPAKDKLDQVPGYPSTYNTSVYSGYLDVKNASRELHYLFVESANGAGNKDPIILWLNGGPGCSSLLGFLQEIGPYYLEEGIDFKKGDLLTENKYSWHKLANLLFLESPAGVGFSYNLDTKYVYNDANTAHDALYAVTDFFNNKFTEFRGRNFFIAGESYAGKYIPDLAMLIDGYNLRGEGVAINLMGILVGNGVMTFETLQKSTYEYMINRKFVDPEIVPIYQSSCQTDPSSAGCRYFQIEYDKGTDEVNPYNVYGYCYYNDSFDLGNQNKPKRQYQSQESILNKLKEEFSPGAKKTSKYNGAPCAFFDGIYDYFNLHEVEFKAKFPGQVWNGPCAQNISYQIDPAGSMHSYRYLLSLIPTSRKMSIILYSGNWDAVVPYVDTQKGIKLLNLYEVYTMNPWFTDKQHSGFEQIYSGVIFITVKGASHQVPQAKRAESYNIIESVIAGHQKGTIFTKGVFPDRRIVVTDQ